MPSATAEPPPIQVKDGIKVSPTFVPFTYYDTFSPDVSCICTGELGFFDNYVIPLAKKLKECGVFGVSSDEYLNYALENRRYVISKLCTIAIFRHFTH